MERVTKFKGDNLKISGTEIKVGDKIPAFKLTANDMSDLTNQNLSGKIVILSAVPSLDTPTCSIETKRLNKEITSLGSSVVVITVSRDLPFAQKRWCGAEGVENVITASDYKYRTFAEQFGVLINDWQLLSRAIFVADKTGVIRHVEYVAEVSEEPDYASLFKAVRAIAA